MKLTEKLDEEFIRGFIKHEENAEPNPLLRDGLRQLDLITHLHHRDTVIIEAVREKVKGLKKGRNPGTRSNWWWYNRALSDFLSTLTNTPKDEKRNKISCME